MMKNAKESMLAWAIWAISGCAVLAAEASQLSGSTRVGDIEYARIGEEVLRLDLHLPEGMPRGDEEIELQPGIEVNHVE